MTRGDVAQNIANGVEDILTTDDKTFGQLKEELRHDLELYETAYCWLQYGLFGDVTGVTRLTPLAVRPVVEDDGEIAFYLLQLDGNRAHLAIDEVIEYSRGDII